MKPDDAEEYTQALGQVVAGGYRQVALGERLGVPRALGLSTRDWVEQRLGGYVRMSLPERREAVAELTAEGMTQREVADVLGVSQKTVDRDLGPESYDSGPEPVHAPDDQQFESSDSEPEPGREPTEWDEEAQRESERRAARSNLRRILTFLAYPTTVPPEKLAADYTDVVNEFDRAELDFAVQTMTAIANLNEGHH